MESIMDSKPDPKCVECEKTESLLWRTVDQGQICQDCYIFKENGNQFSEKLESLKGIDDKKDLKEKQSKDGFDKISLTVADEKRLRKSTRSTRFKSKGTPQPAHTTTTNGNTPSGSASKSQSKGRSRRSIFKKTPFKTPDAQATTHVVESVFHKGSYLQTGDIVSLIDSKDNVYYAQIRGLLVDNYCEKSAFLTWLIPTQASPPPKEGFDPATYLIGPDEDLSRKLSCLEFVMHAPSNYYFDRTTPFPLPDIIDGDYKQGGYIWTSLPEFRRRHSTI